LVYQVEASDANGDNLTYLLAESPAGMLIDSESGKIIWTTPVIGTHRVKIRVDDRRGGVDIQTFEFTVAGASGRITGTVYVDIDADGKRKVTNPGNLIPYDHVTIGDRNQPGNRFKNDYAAYALGRPDGVPGILGGAAFKDENTLLLGGGAASEGGAIYNVRVQRGEGGHIIGFDQDAYTTYFGDAPYNDASIVQLPGGTIWANQWPSSGVTVVRPGGAPYELLPNRLGGMAFVPAGFPGAGELKAFDAYNGSGFRTVNYGLNGTYADGTPRYSHH
jgi:hypothetical protein